MKLKILAGSSYTAHVFRRNFILAILFILCATSAFTQTAEVLSHITKVYVGLFGDDKDADALRAAVTRRLRASQRFQIVSSARDADAVISGTGHTWVTGYVSLGVHASRSNRQPVFDGFLSMDVIGKSGVLWSYLVTPGRFPLNGVTNDLADQMVKRLLDAIQHKSEDASPSAVAQSGSQVSLQGAGATFPWPLYQKWFQTFQEKSPNVTIHYDPVGSESGIGLLIKNEIDFAASDMPLSDQAMAQSNVKFLHVASVLGAVVPIYNLSNVRSPLNFTPEALAGIYLGTITRWNDPALRSSNPGILLPDAPIAVVHRSDGSGTTFVWTDYLSKVSPEWKKRVGSGASISWPVGQGAELNEGVTDLVRRTPDSIGYVELIYAIQHELSPGAVRNAAGEFVRADLESVTAAASTVSETKNSDLRLSITNASGKRAYPISTFTWILFPENSSGEKRSALIEFLKWMLTSGQKQCAGLGYAPLPQSIADRELQILSTLK